MVLSDLRAVRLANPKSITILGFNTVRARQQRWGFCNNVPRQDCQTADSDDADGVIGFGLTGQTGPYGRGVDTSSTTRRTAGRNRASRRGSCATLPRGNTGPGGQHFGEWTVVLKSDGDETFQYSSPLWGSDELLDPGSDVNSPGNAKYEAYNSQSSTRSRCALQGRACSRRTAFEQAFLEPYVNSAALLRAVPAAGRAGGVARGFQPIGPQGVRGMPRKS